MTTIVGPNTRVVGQRLPWFADGTRCDRCDNLAQHRVVVKVASDAIETEDLCNSCFVVVANEAQEPLPPVTRCDFCTLEKTGCTPFRDPSVADSPIYNVCQECQAESVRAAPSEDPLDPDEFEEDYFPDDIPGSEIDDDEDTESDGNQEP